MAELYIYSNNWCPYNENEPMVNLLSIGKYYTYYHEKIYAIPIGIPERELFLPEDPGYSADDYKF